MDWYENWNNYLKKRFGNDIPEKFTLDLGDIDFQLPPLLAATPDGMTIIQKHNRKTGIM